LASTKKDLSAFGLVVTIQADVTLEEDVQRYVKTAVQHFGAIDVFFNNAGVEGRRAPIVEIDVTDFDRVMAVNVRGVLLGLKHILPVMIAQGRGSVINSSSIAGLRGSVGLAPYVASKHAIVGLTKSAALEVAASGVRVNSIHPGPVATRMMRSLDEQRHPDDPGLARRSLESAVPLARYGEPHEIAQAVVYLASDEASYVTGSQHLVDGGMGAT